MNSRLLIFFLIVFSFNSFYENKSFASPLRWKKVKAITYEIKKLPEGKILSIFTSPDKHFQIIEKLEKTGGKDNHAIYFKNGNSYKLIDKYQQIKKVKWADDSTKVYFEAIKDINYDEISYWKISYLPNLNTVFAQVLQMNQ